MSDELLCTCAHVSKSAFRTLLVALPLACNDVQMEIISTKDMYHREYDRQSVAWTEFDKTHALLMTCKLSDRHLEFMSNRRTLLPEVKPVAQQFIFDDDQPSTLAPESLPEWLAALGSGEGLKKSA